MHTMKGLVHIVDLSGAQQHTLTRKSPAEVLAEFYKKHGIEEDDLVGKLRKMREFVGSPPIPSGQPEPYLADYEIGYLSENGCHI